MSTPRFSRAGAWAVLLLCASAASARADLAEIRASKGNRIRVLVVDGAPELFAKTERAPQPGLEREILQNFCRLERLEMEYQTFASVGAALRALQKGEGAIAAGGLTASDNDDLQYSSEVLPSRQVVVTWKRPPVQKLEDLREERVGIVRGTSAAEAVSTAGLTPGQLDDSFAPGSLIPALKSGRVTACILGVETAIPARAGDPEVHLGMYLGPKLSVAFALRKDEPQLKAALNEYVANLRRTASWNRLVLKYFGDSTIDILKATR
jgi:ABC-type amino acid transport substrate-binding protein